jgi:2-phospho-L-lactate/phosphoenolpyruvate guanylyltransferase
MTPAKVLAIPAKPPERAKSRLGPILSQAERAALSVAMLGDVLEACLAQEGWEVLVISPAESVRRMAERAGARGVVEEGGSLLAAVRQIESLIPGPSGTMAVVLADLALITPAALAQALALTAPVVAAPAGSDSGTNVLIRRPADAIPARFGRHSFLKHRWAARRARLPFDVVRLPELAFDLDRPADLEQVLVSEHRGRTREVCLDMRLSERLSVRTGTA